MKIKDVMSKKLVIGKNTDSLKTISELMQRNDIGFIPISKDGKIIGVVTDRDIVVKAIPACAKGSAKIEDYISKGVISCKVDDSIDDVLNCMKESKIKRVLISDHNKVVGIVSISDLLEKKQSYDIIKSIYQINRNDNYQDTEIDEFYL